MLRRFVLTWVGGSFVVELSGWAWVVSCGVCARRFARHFDLWACPVLVRRFVRTGVCMFCAGVGGGAVAYGCLVMGGVFPRCVVSARYIVV